MNERCEANIRFLFFCSPLTSCSQVNIENRTLQERISEIYKFRKQHEDFRTVIVHVLPAMQSGGAVPEINHAFEEIREVDPLNLSREGLEVRRENVDDVIHHSFD